jgi:hypothetical protein
MPFSPRCSWTRHRYSAVTRSSSSTKCQSGDGVPFGTPSLLLEGGEFALEGAGSPLGMAS